MNTFSKVALELLGLCILIGTSIHWAFLGLTCEKRGGAVETSAAYAAPAVAAPESSEPTMLTLRMEGTVRVEGLDTVAGVENLRLAVVGR